MRARVLQSFYYEYAVRRAKSDDGEFEGRIILGCAIAHEVGHLQLGSNRHSGCGFGSHNLADRYNRSVLGEVE
jgi:hypothetical protein